MIYSGSKAIDFLAEASTKTDPVASSHWRKYHSEFQFKDDKFQGLRGFGGNSKPYRGLRKFWHRVNQHSFRRMGRCFKHFNRIDNLASSITTKQDRAYDLDVLRQSLSLAYFFEQLDAMNLPSKPMACVIGDGFATMTSLMISSEFAKTVVLVNLTKTLLVDLWYLKTWMDEELFESSIDLVDNQESLLNLLSRKESDSVNSSSVVAIQANNHELLQQLPIDFAVNIVSMQEMNPSVIADYFLDLHTISSHRNIYFYCCNREVKKLPDGTITQFY